MSPEVTQCSLHILKWYGMSITWRVTVFDDDARHTDRIQVASDLVPLVVVGQNSVATTWTNDDRRSIRLIGRWRVDPNVRLIRRFRALSTGCTLWPKQNRFGTDRRDRPTTDQP
jgi:hypothetical protein